jgi:hypothetical protein
MTHDRFGPLIYSGGANECTALRRGNPLITLDLHALHHCDAPRPRAQLRHHGLEQGLQEALHGERRVLSVHVKVPRARLVWLQHLVEGARRPGQLGQHALCKPLGATRHHHEPFGHALAALPPHVEREQESLLLRSVVFVLGSASLRPVLGSVLGSASTTLLQALAGLVAQTRGSSCLAHKDVQPRSPCQRRWGRRRQGHLCVVLQCGGGVARPPVVLGVLEQALHPPLFHPLSRLGHGT